MDSLVGGGGGGDERVCPCGGWVGGLVDDTVPDCRNPVMPCSDVSAGVHRAAEDEAVAGGPRRAEQHLRHVANRHCHAGLPCQGPQHPRLCLLRDLQDQ